jgi:hypothetical protein
MTQVSFTSGEILDIIKSLEVMESKADLSGDPHLAAYYFGIITQFYRIHEKLKDFQPENRVANLILAVN